MSDFQFLQPKSWRPAKGYSNGIATGERLVFVAGQIGWTDDARLIGSNFVTQVERALMNMFPCWRKPAANRSTSCE